MRTLKFTNQELSQLGELIFNKIDTIGGYENLSPELKSVLEIIQT